MSEVSETRDERHEFPRLSDDVRTLVDVVYFWVRAHNVLFTCGSHCRVTWGVPASLFCFYSVFVFYLFLFSARQDALSNVLLG